MQIATRATPGLPEVLWYTVSSIQIGLFGVRMGGNFLSQLFESENP